MDRFDGVDRLPAHLCHCFHPGKGATAFDSYAGPVFQMAVSLCAGFNSGQTDAGAESRGCFARALRRSKGDGHPMGDSMAHHGASPVYPPLWQRSEARKLGIEITDARVIRLNAHMEDTDVSAHMEAQYQQAANRLRSAGALEAA